MSTLQAEDRQLIQDAVQKFVASNYAFENREARVKQFGKFGGNWNTFAELGWLALPFAEEVGGLGGGVVDAQVLMRAFGCGLIAEPFAEVVLMAGKTLEYGLDATRHEELLAPLMAGARKVVLAHGEEVADAGFENLSCTAQAVAGAYRISGLKRVVWQAGVADWYLVSALLDGQPALFKVDIGIDKLVINEFPTIDSHYAADLHMDGITVSERDLLATGKRAAHAIRQAILFSFAALMGEVSGIADKLVTMTAGYLNTREQFGSKIATFQALQHKLADMVIAAEEIRSLEWLVAGAAELDDASESEKLIRSAKARVGKVAREMAETAVQLHGGIGVSDELIVGHYLRRIIAIDSLYGDSRQQLTWLATQY